MAAASSIQLERKAADVADVALVTMMVAGRATGRQDERIYESAPNATLLMYVMCISGSGAGSHHSSGRGQRGEKEKSAEEVSRESAVASDSFFLLYLL